MPEPSSKPPTDRSFRPHIFSCIKLLILAATVYWIISKTEKDWQAFVEQEKNWGLLSVAFLLVLVAHLISYWRWKILVNALQVPLGLGEAFRLGFLGTLFNNVSVGSVGGDVFKGFLAAQKAPGKATEVVASVLIDRAVGLLGLLIVASIGLTVASSLSPRMSAIKWAAIVLSAIGLGAFTVIGLFGSNVATHRLQRIPSIGNLVERLARACIVFHGRPRLTLELILSSMGVHTCFTAACFLISSALFAAHPTLAEHFSVIPPAMAAATLPITPGGMGVQELAITGLFKELPQVPEGFSAVIMATTFRVLLISICLIGAVYYFVGSGARSPQPRGSEANIG